MAPIVEIRQGDLLQQDVEVIVNPWNRNIIPWWLLWPQGVSGAIKRRAGLEPFREVAKAGSIPAGEAVLTGAGRLPFRGIIHVAGLTLFWRSSEEIVRRPDRRDDHDLPVWSMADWFRSWNHVATRSSMRAISCGRAFKSGRIATTMVFLMPMN